MTDSSSAGWTALVLAGERPSGDPVGRPFGSGPKALVELGGQPMVARVVKTLLACPRIARVAVLSQAGLGVDAALPAGVSWVESGAGIAASVAAAAGGPDAPWPVLVTTADHPLLTPATVAEFLAGAVGAQVGIGIVSRGTVLSRLPVTRRTWLRFRDGGWTGANLFALSGPAARPALDAWALVERDRKSAARLVTRFGPALALAALTRTIPIGEAVARAGERMGLVARAVALSDAGAAIDVDRPEDRRLAELILWAREDERPASPVRVANTARPTSSAGPD